MQFWFVVNVLAAYRLSIPISKDKIFAPLRKWLGWHWGWRSEKLVAAADSRFYKHANTGLWARLGRMFYELVICPWCLSIWLAVMAVTLTDVVPHAWRYPALVFAISGATVLFTRREIE